MNPSHYDIKNNKITAKTGTVTYYHEKCHQIIHEQELDKYLIQLVFLLIISSILCLTYDWVTFSRYMILTAIFLYVAAEEIICWLYAIIRFKNMEMIE
jgi:hypothetical protein